MLLFFPIIRRLCFFGDVLLSEMGDSEKKTGLQRGESRKKLLPFHQILSHTMAGCLALDNESKLLLFGSLHILTSRPQRINLTSTK